MKHMARRTIHLISTKPDPFTLCGLRVAAHADLPASTKLTEVTCRACRRIQGVRINGSGTGSR